MKGQPACLPPLPALSGLFSKPALITSGGCWAPGCQDRATPPPRPSIFHRQQDRDRQRFGHTRVLYVPPVSQSPVHLNRSQSRVFRGEDCWGEEGGWVPIDNHSFLLQVCITEPRHICQVLGSARRVPLSSNHPAHCPSQLAKPFLFDLPRPSR